MNEWLLTILRLSLWPIIVPNFQSKWNIILLASQSTALLVDNALLLCKYCEKGIDLHN